MELGVAKLARNLEAFRHKRGLSQVDFAEEMKVNKSYVSNLEAGKCNPTLNSLDRLARILNISVSDLLK